MAKSSKKKNYKVSGKPKVAQMNDYIYTQLDKPKKPKLVGPKMKRKDYRMRGVEVKYDKSIKRGKPMTATQMSAANAGISTNESFPSRGRTKGMSKNPVGSGEISNTKRMAQLKAQKKAGIGIGDVRNADSVSKAKFGIGKKVKMADGTTRKMTGDIIGYKAANTKMDSQIVPSKQKVKATANPNKIKGYKIGANSPVNLAKASKRLSPAAKRAIISGAKVATKGATRLIPVVGQVLFMKDMYDVNKWATSQPKKKKTNMKLYGQSINKSYKYNK